MKIEVQGTNEVAFSTLSNAEVFKTKRGNYFMKISPIKSKETDEIYTAVDLNLGVSYAIDNTAPVDTAFDTAIDTAVPVDTATTDTATTDTATDTDTATNTDTATL